MFDILDLYKKDYNPNEPGICLDEKPLQLLQDSRPAIPARKSGQIAKFDYEYKRKGTANIFCAVKPKSGRHYAYFSKKKQVWTLLKLSTGWPGIIKMPKLYIW